MVSNMKNLIKKNVSGNMMKHSYIYIIWKYDETLVYIYIYIIYPPTPADSRGSASEEELPAARAKKSLQAARARSKKT